jgi:hypothetical protein
LASRAAIESPIDLTQLLIRTLILATGEGGGMRQYCEASSLFAHTQKVLAVWLTLHRIYRASHFYDASFHGRVIRSRTRLRIKRIDRFPESQHRRGTHYARRYTERMTVMKEDVAQFMSGASAGKARSL